MKGLFQFRHGDHNSEQLKPKRNSSTAVEVLTGLRKLENQTCSPQKRDGSRKCENKHHSVLCTTHHVPPPRTLLPDTQDLRIPPILIIQFQVQSLGTENPTDLVYVAGCSPAIQGREGMPRAHSHRSVMGGSAPSLLLRKAEW